MKKCPLCGREYESEIKCKSCGVFLIDTETNRAVSGNTGKKKHIRAEKKSPFEKRGSGSEPSGKTSSGNNASTGDDPITMALLGGIPVSEKKTEKKEEKAERAIRPEAEGQMGSGDQEHPETEMSQESQTSPEVDAVSGETETSKNIPEPEKVSSKTDQDWITEGVFGTSGKRESSSEGTQRPEREKIDKGQKSSKIEKKSVTITFSPALIAVAAVVILVIAAIVFIVKGMGANEEEKVTPVMQEDTADTADVPVTEPEPDQGPDLSNVTINAYDADYIEVTGHVEDNAGNLRFVFDTPQNIYLYDNYAQKEEVVENVSDVSLDLAAPCPLDGYEGRQMSVRGDMWKEGTNIVLSAWEVLYAEPEQDDPGIHQYQIVVEDCTWYDALTRCTTQGGYLARISSPEEYQYIVDMLNNGGYTNIHFYLGGRRDDTGVDYYWVNEQNEFMGDCLNSGDSWCSSYWYQNEPSFRDTGSDANGEIAENVMNLFCVSGTWYLNDSSDDLAGYYPDLLRGKVGYIIEYEE